MASLPRRVVVRTLTSGRYQAGTRPTSWDARYSGREAIITLDGESIVLDSSGGQSTPAPGWELLLIGASPSADSAAFAPDSNNGEINSGRAYSWTLYGIRSDNGTGD